MLLVDQVKKLKSDTAALEKQIEKCEHDWHVGGILTVTLRTTVNEAMGGIPYFARIQQRLCPKCGLKQEKIQHGPTIGWTDWNEPNIYIGNLEYFNRK